MAEFPRLPTIGQGPGQPRAESGSAAVEYVLVSFLLIVVVAGIAQILVVIHTRTVVSDAATDAARIAAYADGSIVTARERAHVVVAASLGEEFARATELSITTDGERVEVVMRAPLMAVGFTTPINEFRVDAGAVSEKPDE
ncbi:MAG: TadE family protein [Mycetocola sp.]